MTTTIELTSDEQRDLMRKAWDEGFEQGVLAGEGDEYTDNPYTPATVCAFPAGCTAPAEHRRQVCRPHRLALAELLKSAPGAR